MLLTFDVINIKEDHNEDRSLITDMLELRHNQKN